MLPWNTAARKEWQVSKSERLKQGRPKIAIARAVREEEAVDAPCSPSHA